MLPITATTAPPSLRPEAQPAPSSAGLQPRTMANRADPVLAAAARTQDVSTTTGQARSFVDGVAEVCIRRGVAAALAYLDRGAHHGDAVVADGLQQLIIALPRGRSVGAGGQTAQADALRELLLRVTQATEHGHSRNGMAAFMQRSSTVAPLAAAAEVHGKHDELELLLGSLPGWQYAAAGEVMDALRDDAPICCHALWSHYALDQESWDTARIREHIWTLLILGKENRFVHARHIQRAATFKGPIVKALADGHDADSVCSQFLITDGRLRQWVHAAAPLLASGRALDQANALPFQAGI